MSVREMNIDDQEDEFEALAHEIAAEQTRILKMDPSNANLRAQLSGTVMSMLAELTKLCGRSAEGIYGDLDERLTALESESESQLNEEDAQKFIALADAMIWLVDAVTMAGSNPEWVDRLAAGKALAAECKTIATESSLANDDDNDDA